jgi:hypothetical protein
MIAGHTAQVVVFGKCTGYVDTYLGRHPCPLCNLTGVLQELGLMDRTPVTEDRRDGNEVAEIRARYFDTGKAGAAYRKAKWPIESRHAIEVLFDEIDRLRARYEPPRPQQ